jgi:hypothetical protein
MTFHLLQEEKILSPKGNFSIFGHKNQFAGKPAVSYKKIPFQKYS